MQDRIYMGGLVGHTNVNVDFATLEDHELEARARELASQLGSAIDPVCPGSLANRIFAPQAAAILRRHAACAAECERRGRRVWGISDTRSSAEGDRRWRARRA